MSEKFNVRGRQIRIKTVDLENVEVRRQCRILYRKFSWFSTISQKKVSTQREI